MVLGTARLLRFRSHIHLLGVFLQSAGETVARKKLSPSSIKYPLDHPSIGAIEGFLEERRPRNCEAVAGDKALGNRRVLSAFFAASAEIDRLISLTDIKERGVSLLGDSIEAKQNYLNL